MTIASRAAAVAMLLAWAVPAVASGVHGTVRATITIGPQLPSVDERWRVTAWLPSGDRRLHPSRRVKAIGEMTGHPMRPVEAALLPSDESGTFTGELRFTMPGPWIVTLRVEDLNEVMTGTFEVTVVRADEPNGLPEIRSVLDLHQPARPNLVPPAWALSATVVLILGLEWAAVALARRGSPRESSPA